MKTIIWIIIMIAIMLYIAGLEISFKPFTIKFNNLINLLGMIFLILTMLCWDYIAFTRGYTEGYKNSDFIKGYSKGAEDMNKKIVEEIKVQIKSKGNETKDNFK